MLESAPPTFVLIHGAWHGGWCWGRVSERLRAKGARVLTPTLCGLAERASLATPEVGLNTHINEIAALCDVEAQQGPLVLCGHSYGGLVLVGALEKIQARAQAQVKAAVFLDAFVPEAGQSLFDMAGPQAAQRFASMRLEQGGCTLVAPVPAALGGRRMHASTPALLHRKNRRGGGLGARVHQNLRPGQRLRAARF